MNRRFNEGSTVISGIMTLTTDFGTAGPYVAEMKGVVLGLAPRTQIVDVSHSILPQDIIQGAFILESIVDSFPDGTVHVAVVDPGVGTDRRVIAVVADRQRFVLPDNGLIGGVLRRKNPSGIWQISNPDIFRSKVSSTFHGRDIMAPAAAHLLNGGDPNDLGPSVTDLKLGVINEAKESSSGLEGEVVYRDTFGNLITNIRAEHLTSKPLAEWSVEILGRRIDGLISTYGVCTPGSLVALIGSSDRVEVAVVNGDAAKCLQAARGTQVAVRPKREPSA